jgi:hypothetical protein
MINLLGLGLIGLIGRIEKFLVNAVAVQHFPTNLWVQFCTVFPVGSPLVGPWVM